jgi:hypothetical protein
MKRPRPETVDSKSINDFLAIKIKCKIIKKKEIITTYIFVRVLVFLNKKNALNQLR